MAVLKPRYEYDVFFSYAWAEASGGTEVREWSIAVINKVISLLRTRYNHDETLQFSHYLDRDKSKTGADLDATLETAVKQSAIFVALVSPYYCKSPYCTKELEWFLSDADSATIADRLCVLQVQKTGDDLWPGHLKASGRPLLYKDLTGEDGLPKGFAEFVADGRPSNLANLISDIALEVSGKIAVLKSRREAQEAYQRSQFLPDKPLLFFEAEAADLHRWNECRGALKDVPSIVLPPIPKPATALEPDAKEVKHCSGFLMLRTREDDDFGERIKSAYLRLQKLYRVDKEHIPWALLDEQPTAPPEQEIYNIPRVELQGEWLAALREAIRC